MAFCVYLILHAIEWGQLKKSALHLQARYHLNKSTESCFWLHADQLHTVNKAKAHKLRLFL